MLCVRTVSASNRSANAAVSRVANSC